MSELKDSALILIKLAGDANYSNEMMLCLSNFRNYPCSEPILAQYVSILRTMVDDSKSMPSWLGLLLKS